MAGFIVIDRKIVEWKFWQNATASALWFHILVNANWKDGFYHCVHIPRGAFATSMRHLSEELDVSEKTVRKWLKRFEEEGQISLEPGKHFTVIKVLNYSAYQDITVLRGTEQSSQQSTERGLADSSVEGSNDGSVEGTDNRTNKPYEPKKPLNQENKYTVESKTVIDLLNRKTGKSFRYTESNLKHIRARFNDGAKLDDFETVINRKYRQWHGTDMEKYLRPETLFGTKFDSYLNEGNESMNGGNIVIDTPDWYNRQKNGTQQREPEDTSDLIAEIEEMRKEMNNGNKEASSD